MVSLRKFVILITSFYVAQYFIDVFFSDTEISEHALDSIIKSNQWVSLDTIQVDRENNIAYSKFKTKDGGTRKYTTYLSNQPQAFQYIDTKNIPVNYYHPFEITKYINFQNLFLLWLTYQVLFVVKKYIKFYFDSKLGKQKSEDSDESDISNDSDISDSDESKGIFNLKSLFTPSVEKMDMNVEDNVQTRFSDVAGCIEAKREIEKIVHMFKNRSKYTTLGAHLPRGILMSGPPGCGKTLLAKAVAGEAGVQFISTTGSDFNQMFIGVGASRVKELFTKARKNAPSIIFIDEIDSIGSKRGGASMNSGSKEYDTVLNKILTEMDGFKTTDNVMVFASTNQIEILDPALTRSGRFDTKIIVDYPNRQEREEILELYLNKIKLNPNKTSDIKTSEDKTSEDKTSEDKTSDDKTSEDKTSDDKTSDDKTSDDKTSDEYSLCKLVKMYGQKTLGLSGADIANFINQASIRAASHEMDHVREIDLREALDCVMIGYERKSRTLNKIELQTVTYHECGHALIGYILRETISPIKISIIPRGEGALGYTQPGTDERVLLQKEEMIGRIYTLLGGRAAEDLMMGCITGGASDDFSKATNLLETMCSRYGMSSLGLRTIVMNRQNANHDSDETIYRVEELVNETMNVIYKDVLKILKKNKEHLERLSKKVAEKENLEVDEIEECLGKEMESSLNVLNNLL